jgi:predicted nucleic acid-binding protein
MTQACIVADAGPLIALARIERLGLLPSLFGDVFVPEAVYEECIRIPGKPGATGIREAVEVGDLTVRVPAEAVRVPPALGNGEGQAILLALELELECPVLLDDKLARGYARRAGVTVIGTGGVLLAAKSKSLIAAVAPLLDELTDAGYHFCEELANRIRELAGEARSSGP